MRGRNYPSSFFNDLLLISNCDSLKRVEAGYSIRPPVLLVHEDWASWLRGTKRSEFFLHLYDRKPSLVSTLAPRFLAKGNEISECNFHPVTRKPSLITTGSQEYSMAFKYFLLINIELILAQRRLQAN